MQVNDFDYRLPSELVAQEPAEPRDAARLMLVPRRGGSLQHRVFRELPDILQPGDTLVVNDTRVIPARLQGRKAAGGGLVEVLLLRRLRADCWEALVRPGRRIPPGSQLIFGQGELAAVVGERLEQGLRLVEFSYQGVWEEVLGKVGEMPLPPYIKHTTAPPERYQTVYAHHQGSAAAPTAGLHFTPNLLEHLRQQGVEVVELLLHLGLGTFRPVQVATVEEHLMHSEYYQVEAEAAQRINQARARGGRVVAVGTTVVRTLETVAAPDGTICAGSGWTDIFIYPGYRFRAVDALITNFHLPKSTLLMLLAAYLGRERMLEAYQTAIEERYRFYSFGDAMLII